MSKTRKTPDLELVLPDTARKAVGKHLPTRALGPLNAAVAVKDVVDAVTDYGRTRQQERTRRQAIAAAERVAVQRTTAQTQLLAEGMTRSFDERAPVLAAEVALLHKAMDKEAPELLDRAATLLIRTLEDNPLRHAGALLSDDAAVPGAVWDL